MTSSVYQPELTSAQRGSGPACRPGALPGMPGFTVRGVPADRRAKVSTRESLAHFPLASVIQHDTMTVHDRHVWVRSGIDGQAGDVARSAARENRRNGGSSWRGSDGNHCRYGERQESESTWSATAAGNGAI